ncbi:permease prefix domain 1-containing protein [Amycolatopsis suaedae]|uniref:Uncharacterized protein n=1 Tax=Amycolatopsis suaedae TaxID=2510978 RepID=A0A4Q7JFE2_9PSEU|nr:permease prefix domain 1-containing protein [Amycolatopsis suaedae]RZQ65583.1 hypothetical protein EWH70_00325 [Amycolatopsis suaedae]
MGVIEGYLDELAGTLRGAPAAKADLLAEARDGLDDAAESYRARGFDPAEAERRAVADFGTVAQVRRDFQAELGVAAGVQVLRSLALALPLMHVIWELTRITSFGEWSRVGAVLPEWFGQLSRLSDGSGYVVAGLAVLALLATRLLSRYGRVTGLARWLAVLALTGAVGDLAVRMVLMTVAGSHDLGLLFLSPSTAVVGLMSFLVSLRLLMLAARSWRARVA